MTDREKLIGIVKSSLIKHIDKSCCLAENIVDDLLTEGVTTQPVAFSDNRRERMIELLGGYYEETGINIVHYFTDEESEMLADYILADGWIRPSCKVGDKIYGLFESNRLDRKTRVVEYIVDELLFSSKRGVRPWIICCYGGRRFDNCDFGETVFLTREEAEKALAKRSVTE